MAAGELRPPEIADPLIGQVLSERYRIIKKLGEGGMGAVYLAEHVFIEKKVALKVLAPELARRQDLAIRFLQEARAASRIGQENIIDISDFGQNEAGLVFFAMEFLEGVDLGETIRKEGPMPWPRAKRIVLQIGKALRAAHKLGIVHRDLKPENIFLIKKEGRSDFVKLLDFGIAKMTGVGADASAPKLTRTGMIFGTPEYMAPEQAEGKEADHRVDIYAVGCVIYHLITGVTPFQADSFMAMLTKHLLEDAVPPSQRRRDLAIPPELDVVVMRALAKDRDQRWPHIDEMMAAAAAIGDPVDATFTGEPTGAGGATAPPAHVTAGPKVAATKTPAGAAAAPAATRQLGGSSAGLQVIRSTSRESHTQLVDADDASTPPKDAAPAKERKGSVGLLVGIGVAVGIAGAIAYVVASRRAIPEAPSGVVTPAAGASPPVAAPAPAASEPVPPTPAAAAPPRAPETALGGAAPSGQEAERDKSDEKVARSTLRERRGSNKPGYRRIEAPSEQATTPPAGVKAPKPEPSTPVELKPFPGQ
jgi:tRNA A-37 threonylcarbamoyl transferase component Bud32